MATCYKFWDFGWGESKGCLIKGCLNSTKTLKVGIPEAGIPTVGIPKAGIPKAGIPEVGKTHTGTHPETEIPKPGILKSGIPKTGTLKAGIAKLGIPKTGRIMAPLLQTPLNRKRRPTPGHPGQIFGICPIPPFETQARQTFEGGHELFGHHPFAWKIKKLIFVLFFIRPDLGSL